MDNNKLHDAIMNLPAKHADDVYVTPGLAYKCGHRDARHAAAELAIEFAAQAAQSQPPVPRVGGITLSEICADWKSGVISGQESMCRVAAAIASQSQAAQPTEWQPIESAPKDGRTLLLGCFNTRGKWLTMRGQWFSEAAIAEDWEDPDDAEEGWYETAVEPDVPNCWGITPTHWMSLPAALGSHIAGTSQATKAQAEPEIAKALRELMSIVRIHSDATSENFAWAEMQYAEAVLAAPVAKEAQTSTPKPWEQCIDLDAYDSNSRRDSAAMYQMAREISQWRSVASVAKEAEKEQQALVFANHIINGAFDGGDWGGGDVQELAAKCGLLKLEVMAEPCGDEGSCRCAQGVPFFPAECYRKTYRAPTTQQAANAESERAEGEQAHVMPPMRQLSEVINHAIAAKKRGLEVSQIFAVSPTDANGWLARFIMDAIEFYRPDVSDIAPVASPAQQVEPEVSSTVRALCMLVAEAAYKEGSGSDRAVARDKLRPIVDEVLNLESDLAPTTSTVSAPAQPFSADERDELAAYGINAEKLVKVGELPVHSTCAYERDDGSNCECGWPAKCCREYAKQELRTSTDQANADTGSAE